MKKIMYLSAIVFILLISCTDKKSESMEENNKTLTFHSAGGNFLEIVIPDGEIYSFENISLTLKFSYNKNQSLLMPDWSEMDDSLKIISVKSISGPIEDNHKILMTQELTIGALLPGDYLLNPMTIGFYSNSELVDELMTEYIPLKIQSSLIEGEDDIVDNFDFLSSKKINIPLIIALIVLLFSTIGACIFLILKKREKSSLSINGEVKNYTDLINKSDTENIKVLYKDLNDLLKEFLENKMFLSVRSQTTEEFIMYSKITPILEEWLKKQLFDFLKRSDEIRFGERIPDEERINGDKQFCTDFIEYVNKKVIDEVTL